MSSAAELATEMSERYEQSIRNQLAIINGMQQKLLAIDRIASELLESADDVIAPRGGRRVYGELIRGIVSNRVQVDDRGSITQPM